MGPLLYLDTSAVLDRALGQERHREIAAAMREHVRGGGRLVASRLLHLEARRAFVREQRRGQDVSPVIDLVEQVIALPVSEDVWAAAHAIDQHVRTLDAIHLATCALIDAPLLSTDVGMLQAADALGVPIHPASTASTPNAQRPGVSPGMRKAARRTERPSAVSPRARAGPCRP